ncbi:MAG: hypothetical protein ABSC13_02250 [Dehalococcoidia bacterium]
MPAKEKAFHLVFAIGVGLASYDLLYNFADFTVVPFFRGFFNGTDGPGLYLDLPLSVNFRGYPLVYSGALAALCMLVLGAAALLLLVWYSRHMQQRASPPANVEECPCRECRSFIPAAAKRCHWCRSPQEPQAEAPADST